MASRPFLLCMALFVVASVHGCADPGRPSEPAMDASVDVAESGPVPNGDDANACPPGDVETFQPASYRFASAPGLGVCLAGMFGFDPIQGFYDACLGPVASPAKCSAFKNAGATASCAQCISTLDTDTHYGPLIDHLGFITANVAGCVELTDPSNLSCAKALQAVTGCELAACEANCPVHDAASRAAYDACAATADDAGCHSYSKKAADCIQAELDGGPAAVCLAPTFLQFYRTVVPIFCGPLPSRDGGSLFFDASADAPSDASVDSSSDAITPAPDARADGAAESSPPDATASDGSSDGMRD